MSTKYKRIKDELEEAGMNTTGHVISLIIKSQNLPMKIIFLLAWLAGFGLTLYLIVSSILDYYKYDVLTQTRVIREQPMLFPKVMICNSDRFVTNASIPFLADLIRSDGSFTTKISEATEAGATSDLDFVNWFIEEGVDFEPQALFAAYSANKSTQMSLGYDKDTFIEWCLFDDSPCSSNFMEHIYDVKFGNCFMFNGQTRLDSKGSGNSIKTNSGYLIFWY